MHAAGVSPLQAPFRSAVAPTRGALASSHATVAAPCCRRAAFTVRAGWFDNFGASTDRKKDEAYRIQQEILSARRTGKKNDEVEKRRAEVARYMKLSKDEQRKYREANPDNAGPIYQEEPKWFGSSILPTIIIPQAPFGDPKMDGGERWDLKAKYTDEGYEDEDADVMGKLAKFFGGGKKE